MSSAPVGVQCALTSSLGDFPGYWDWLWYPGLSPVLVSNAFPFAFHIWAFPFTLLRLPLDFISLLFTAAVSAPRHQPSSCNRAWDGHRATVDPEKEFYIHTYAHNAYINTFMHACIRTYIHTGTLTCIHIRTCIHTYITYAHRPTIHIYIHTSIHTNKHTHIHTYIQTRTSYCSDV